MKKMLQNEAPFNESVCSNQYNPKFTHL